LSVKHLHRRRVLTSLLAGALLLGAGGCGFHLRSYGFGGSVDSYALVGRTNLEVAESLRRQLDQAGVAEVSPGEAALVLELLDQRRDRRSVSTSDGARAAEYETILAVQYRVLDNAGAELVEPSWIERMRVYRIDRGNIVGTSGEREILERELLDDLAAQLLRVMDTVGQQLQSGTSEASAG
jgi:LPS-assembly lipoprotein